jgi:hypothetical protein
MYLGHRRPDETRPYVAAAVARISPRCLRRRLACPPSTSSTSRTSHARNAPPPQGVPCELHAVPGICHRIDVFFRDRANIAALHEDMMKALSEVVR